jgi:hypothetical protein
MMKCVVIQSASSNIIHDMSIFFKEYDTQHSQTYVTFPQVRSLRGLRMWFDLKLRLYASGLEPHNIDIYVYLYELFPMYIHGQYSPFVK